MVVEIKTISFLFYWNHLPALPYYSYLLRGKKRVANVVAMYQLSVTLSELLYSTLSELCSMLNYVILM
ncbi:MAG: hypothetical protein IKJ52_04205 [Muribaculaceae bacterium]|nr:hypothetical protein [Muribaculaceae bacterium]